MLIPLIAISVFFLAAGAGYAMTGDVTLLLTSLTLSLCWAVTFVFWLRRRGGVRWSLRSRRTVLWLNAVAWLALGTVGYSASKGYEVGDGFAVLAAAAFAFSALTLKAPPKPVPTRSSPQV